MTHSQTPLKETLKTRIENRLADEGLLACLPEAVTVRMLRREKWHVYWIAWLTVVAALTVSLFTRSIAAIVGNALFAGTVAFVLFHGLDLLQYQYGRRLHFLDVRSLVRIWLILSASAVAVSSTVLAHHILCAVVSIGLAVLGYGLLRMAFSHFIYAFSVGRELKRSLASIPRVLPLVVILIAISVFAQELWSSVGSLSVERLALVVFLIISLASLLVFSKWEALVSQFPAPDSCEVWPPIQTALGDLVGKERADATHLIELEMGWRDIAMCRKLHLGRIRQAWKIRLVVRFVSAGVWLGFGLYVALFLLFYVIFDGEALDYLLSGNANPSAVLAASGGGSVLPAIAKVVAFLVALLVAEFFARVLEDENLQKLVFGDLKSKVQEWSDLLLVYDALSQPGFFILEKRNHKAIHVLELELAVAADGAEDSASVMRHIAEMFPQPRKAKIVMAFHVDESRNYGEWAPCHRWNGFIARDGEQDVMFTAWTQEPASQSHDLGANALEGGPEPPDEWFGNGFSARLGRLIWEEKAAELQVLHPYACHFDSRMLSILIQTRYVHVDDVLAKDTAKRLQQYLAGCEECDSFPEIIRISIFPHDRGSECGHLIWLLGNSQTHWVAARADA